MDFTAEQIEKAKKCNTLDELKELVKNEGLTLDAEELNEIFNLTRNGELNDDDLNAVVGGKGWEPVWTRNYNVKCPFCGASLNISVTKSEKTGEYKFSWTPYKCTCGAKIIYNDENVSFWFNKNGQSRKT